MNEESNVKQQENISPSDAQTKQELKVHNPFDADDDKKITQEDIDKEQIIKEAQTERD